MKAPEIITQYLDAANRFDAAGAAECFTAHARVHDEAHDHVGQDAIRRWIADTSEKYQPKVDVVQVGSEGARITLSARVSGRFPGSPVDLKYGITLEGGKIATLEIGPA